MIVGPDGRPLEDGEARARDEGGELVIRSAFLAKGYWRDEALTRTVFRDVPGRPGLREYRTGDLGRRLPDGTLEHLGRADSQVKVHGFRVEVTEVEAALESIDEVAAAAVGTRIAAGGGTAITAWIMPVRGRTLSYGDLRRKLAEMLPGPMIPTSFVVVRSVPGRRTASSIVRLSRRFPAMVSGRRGASPTRATRSRPASPPSGPTSSVSRSSASTRASSTSVAIRSGR
ncbi:MAG: AMP-binding protein [Holophagales bacterium]|nr:AMP-binding protein [Holophagales bacterium]